MRSALTLALLLAATVAHAGAQEDLFTACKQGDLPGVERALAGGAQVNALNAEGSTALAQAFFWPEITRLLLDKGANVNLGKTKPVFQAAVFYSVEVLRLLLDKGADPNLPTMVEPSAIFRPLIAAERAKGASANLQMIAAWENAMRTLPPTQAFPLPTAVKGTSCAPCIEMLLQKGAKIVPTAEGNLLHTLADSLSISNEQWKKGFKTTRDNIGAFGIKLPDWYAETMPPDRFGDPEPAVKLLVARGLNINEKSKPVGGMGPMTPLEIALNGGFGSKREVLLALVKNGADARGTHPTYGPFILQAAAIGFADVLKAMIEKGADVNAQGLVFADGSKTALARTFTPLTAAALKNRTEAVVYLLAAGGSSRGGVSGQITIPGRRDALSGHAPICLADAKNKSALYFAIENDNLEMARAIVDKGDWNGQKFSVTASRTSGCIGGGSYSPTEWAKATQASPALLDYLQSKGM